MGALEIIKYGMYFTGGWNFCIVTRGPEPGQFELHGNP